MTSWTRPLTENSRETNSLLLAVSRREAIFRTNHLHAILKPSPCNPLTIESRLCFTQQSLSLACVFYPAVLDLTSLSFILLARCLPSRSLCHLCRRIGGSLMTPRGRYRRQTTCFTQHNMPTLLVPGRFLVKFEFYEPFTCNRSWIVNKYYHKLKKDE